MLSYHPALDPYHTAFRNVRVFMLARRPIEYDRLRLLDLYLLFPEFVRDTRLPRSARAWRRRLRDRANEYLLIPTHVVHRFRRMSSTDSDPCRPPIPTDAVHRFRRMTSTPVRPRWGAPVRLARGSRAGGEGCWMT